MSGPHDDLRRFLTGAADEPPAALPPALRTQAEAARAFVLAAGPPPRELDATVARGLADALAARGDTARLTRLAAEAGKALAKEARRGLHTLRTHGAAVEVPRPAAEAHPAVRLGPVEEEAEVDSVVSMIDGRGERGVWLCRRTTGGVLVYQAVISETQGLVDFSSGRASRKHQRELVHELTERPEFTAARVPADYARWLIEEAYERTLAAHRTLPGDFAQVRRELGPVPRRFEPHPALELWPEAGPVEEAEAARLLELPEVRSWGPERAELQRMALKLDEIEQSRLLVNERQKAEARADALARETASYFTAERRARYRRRLLDTAYLVHLVPGRDEDARRLRAAADGFLAEEPDAFMRGLVERSLALVPEVAEPREPGEDRTPGGLIVPPRLREP